MYSASGERHNRREPSGVMLGLDAWRMSLQRSIRSSRLNGTALPHSRLVDLDRACSSERVTRKQRGVRAGLRSRLPIRNLNACRVRALSWLELVADLILDREALKGVIRKYGWSL
jgi:hypothetical protein